MNKTELVAIRGPLEDDYNFILATWLRGLYYGDTWYGEIPKSIFMENYHKVINFILTKPDTAVKVACLKEDPSVILGYAIITKGGKMLSWCFVKRSWRNIGIAKDLVPSTVTTVGHLTKIGLSIIKRKNLVFNPFDV